MIRRNPTLIPMSDADVQDVRDMVALEAQLSKEGGDASNVNVQQLLSELKAKRLGLKPGVFTVQQCLRESPISGFLLLINLIE